MHRQHAYACMYNTSARAYVVQLGCFQKYVLCARACRHAYDQQRRRGQLAHARFIYLHPYNIVAAASGPAQISRITYSNNVCHYSCNAGTSSIMEIISGESAHTLSVHASLLYIARRSPPCTYTLSLTCEEERGEPDQGNQELIPMQLMTHATDSAP